jgi:hypothetical protein
LKHFDEVDLMDLERGQVSSGRRSDGISQRNVVMTQGVCAEVVSESTSGECSHECAARSEAETSCVTCLYSLTARLARVCMGVSGCRMGAGALEVMADDVSCRRRRRALSVVAPIGVVICSQIRIVCGYGA